MGYVANTVQHLRATLPSNTHTMELILLLWLTAERGLRESADWAESETWRELAGALQPTIDSVSIADRLAIHDRICGRHGDGIGEILAILRATLPVPTSRI